MGFWQTGYREFREPVGLDEFVWQPPPPVRYVCEQCSHHFADLEALRRHRFEQHPLRQPTLLVRGRAVGQLPLKLMSPLRMVDIVVEDATHCLFNGHSLTPVALRKRLVTITREFVTLELIGTGVRTQCSLDFSVANEAHVKGVESAFLRMARDRALNMDALAGFIRDCREFPSAVPYCDGICQYLYGVMAKERSSDSGLRSEQYVEKFLQATDVLANFDRVIAYSVRALVAFHFNHFEDAELLAPEGALRNAAGAFAGLLQGLPWHYETAFSSSPGGAIADLLTDQDTVQLLADASKGLVELKAIAGELLAHVRRAPSNYDRLKHALLAAEALSALDDAASRVEARKLAREWTGHPDTSAWAEAMLERLSTP